MVSRSSNDNATATVVAAPEAARLRTGLTNSARSSTLQPRRPPASTSPARPRSENSASADFGFLSTAQLHKSQEVRRDYDMRLMRPVTMIADLDRGRRDVAERDGFVYPLEDWKKDDGGSDVGDR
jgi:hypothetical protein